MNKFEWRPDPGWPDGRVWDLYVSGRRATWNYVGKELHEYGGLIFACAVHMVNEKVNFTNLREAAAWVQEQYNAKH